MTERGVTALARRWWRGELGVAGSVLDVGLAPAEVLYRGAIAARNAAFDAGIRPVHHVDIRVISVGNVAVGGTGKTPVAHFIALGLRERGARPAILHGGYADDEPALHRQWSSDIPVVVDADRVRGAAAARAQGANVVVLDDGFQHRRLHRDLDIVLISAERWQSAPRLLPRGPWREPHAALLRADLIIVTRKTAMHARTHEVRQQLEQFTKCPIVVAHLQAGGWLHCGVAAEKPTVPGIAVAALAEPELFADSVRLTGLTVTSLIGFRDHHVYSAEDARMIAAQAAGAPIVTTEKDWVKLKTLLPSEQVWVLTQRVHIEHGSDILDTQLTQALANGRDARSSERP
jgi:tetraacyldisaccharide 4'-kinase